MITRKSIIQALNLGPFQSSISDAAMELRATAYKWRGVFDTKAPILRSVVDGFHNIGLTLETMDQEERATAKTLARYGWFIHPDLPMGSSREIATLFDRCDVERGHETQCLLIDEQLGEIEAAIVAENPKRASILALAFSAHRRGEYALSIPVLLAQADGICNDHFSIQLFARKRASREMKLVDKLGNIAERINSSIGPLLEATPIAWNPSERKNAGPILNRHAIMHGEDVEYGTRLNGCRAISYLRYTSAYLKLHKEFQDSDQLTSKPG